MLDNKMVQSGLVSDASYLRLGLRLNLFSLLASPKLTALRCKKYDQMMNDSKMKNAIPPELVELTDQIGTFMEYWGFKKIHGQIWSHIFLAKTPLDATTLVRRLQVSKALVSLAIKDLLQYDVIRVVGQGEKRTILFQSNPDLIAVITSVLRMRERKMLSQIMSSWKNLNKAKQHHTDECELINPKAMQDLGEMIESAEQVLDLMIQSQMTFPMEICPSAPERNS